MSNTNPHVAPVILLLWQISTNINKRLLKLLNTKTCDVRNTNACLRLAQKVVGKYLFIVHIVLLAVITIRSFLHSWFISRFTTRVAQRVQLVDHPEFIQGFWWGSFCSIFSFMINFLLIIVCHFVIFLFGHFIVCNWIYDFWLTLLYLQMLLHRIATLILV